MTRPLRPIGFVLQRLSAGTSVETGAANPTSELPPTHRAVLSRLPPRRRAPSAASELLENLVEATLDAASFLLDVLVVHRDDLEALEIGRALRRRDIDPSGIAAVGGKNLLGCVAQHELREQLGGVRIGRTLDHRG